MRLLGYEITRAKSGEATLPVEAQFSGRGWWPLIREPFTGAWQRNMAQGVESVLSHPTVYACISLIAADVGKLGLRLVQQDSHGIWTPVDVPAYSPVLRRPNRYQNRIQFMQWWVTSKLTHGQTIVLKQRDNRGVVTGLYILDPRGTKPLVAPDGSIYYQLKADNLSGVNEGVTVPASEIIHDVMNPLYHPLCGVSPITACGLAAVQGLNIQRNAVKFFANGAQPGGVLTAPGEIDDPTAARIKTYWEENFTGENAGRVAVLGSGMTYVPMTANAVDSQLIEQLKWSDEKVCSVYHVPPYMVGVGAAPAYNNVEALTQAYYSQCLQIHIESIEICLDEGLGLTERKEGGKLYGTEFDLDDLLRMDSATQIKTLAEGVKGGIHKPDEARRRVNLPPVPGGDAVYLQQQNYSLAALAKRDASDDPFGTAKPEPAPAAEPPPAANDDEQEAASFLAGFRKGLA